MQEREREEERERGREGERVKLHRYKSIVKQNKYFNSQKFRFVHNYKKMSV
jgi:hypothetical protein